MYELKKETKEYSAGIILYREEQGKRKYLILHYPGGHFDFPKGHLEAGETDQQAAVRELEEETGVSVIQLQEGFLEPIHYRFQRRDLRVSKQVTFFLAVTEHREVRISHEHRGYLWLDYEAALAKITFENARNLLRQAEQFLTAKQKENENKL